MKYLLSAVAAVFFAAQAYADDVVLRVAGWNMESGESQDTLLERQLGEKKGVDVWGLSEVRNSTALSAYETGSEIGEGANFDAVLGTSGRSDRLAIIFNTERLTLLSYEELDDPEFRNHRAPLVATFEGKESGIEFLFMVNHLARGNADARLKQARFLNEWVRDQALPVMAVGDYNFDYHITFGENGRRDDAFDAMIEDEAWIWLEPETLVKTQASDSFMTVLDFVFVANPPLGWMAESTILSRSGDDAATAVDFDDSNSETDHRPVDAVFRGKIGPPRAIDALEDELVALQDNDAELLSRIQALENEVERLKSQLEQ